MLFPVQRATLTHFTASQQQQASGKSQKCCTPECVPVTEPRSLVVRTLTGPDQECVRHHDKLMQQNDAENPPSYIYFLGH